MVHHYTHLQPVEHCEVYPVLKYILEVRGPSTMLNIESFELEKPSISVDDLPEDAILAFTISVLNSFGSISSNETTICKCHSITVTVFSHDVMQLLVLLLHRYNRCSGGQNGNWH